MKLAYFEGFAGDADNLQARFPNVEISIVEGVLNELSAPGVSDVDVVSVFIEIRNHAGGAGFTA